MSLAAEPLDAIEQIVAHGASDQVCARSRTIADRLDQRSAKLWPSELNAVRSHNFKHRAATPAWPEVVAPAADGGRRAAAF